MSWRRPRRRSAGVPAPRRPALWRACPRTTDEVGVALGPVLSDRAPRGAPRLDERLGCRWAHRTPRPSRQPGIIARGDSDSACRVFVGGWRCREGFAGDLSRDLDDLSERARRTTSTSPRPGEPGRSWLACSSSEAFTATRCDPRPRRRRRGARRAPFERGTASTWPASRLSMPLPRQPRGCLDSGPSSRHRWRSEPSPPWRAGLGERVLGRPRIVPVDAQAPEIACSPARVAPSRDERRPSSMGFVALRRMR